MNLVSPIFSSACLGVNFTGFSTEMILSFGINGSLMSSFSIWITFISFFLSYSTGLNSSKMMSWCSESRCRFYVQILGEEHSVFNIQYVSSTFFVAVNYHVEEVSFWCYLSESCVGFFMFVCFLFKRGMDLGFAKWFFLHLLKLNVCVFIS